MLDLYIWRTELSKGVTNPKIPTAVMMNRNNFTSAMIKRHVSQIASKGGWGERENRNGKSHQAKEKTMSCNIYEKELGQIFFLKWEETLYMYTSYMYTNV